MLWLVRAFGGDAEVLGLVLRELREHDTDFFQVQAGDELRESWDTGNKILSALILGIVVAIYLYFSFWLS